MFLIHDSLLICRLNVLVGGMEVVSLVQMAGTLPCPQSIEASVVARTGIYFCGLTRKTCLFSPAELSDSLPLFPSPNVLGNIILKVFRDIGRT